MSAPNSEELFNPWKGDLNSSLDLWHPNRLAPMDRRRQHYDGEPFFYLPSISTYITDFSPQDLASSARHSYNTNSHVGANMPFHLPYQGSGQYPFYGGNGYQQIVHPVAPQPLNLLLSPHHTYGPLQPSYQPSVGTANYPSPPSQYHFPALRPTSIATTYPQPPAPQTSPTPSNSPHDTDISNPPTPSNTPPITDTSNPPTPSNSPTETSTSPQNPPTRSERAKTYHAKLAAVNGFIIPSKRSPGHPPLQGKHPGSGGKRPMQYPCAICSERFGRVYQVQSHFAACVGRNGNPDGVCWDDGLDKSVRMGRRRRRR